MAVTAEILVVNGPGQGHLHPCMELCLLLTRRSYFTTLIIPSNVSSVVPSSFASNPLVDVVQIARSSDPPMRDSNPPNQHASQDLSAYLENRTASSEMPRVLCTVVDLKVWQTKEVFWKFKVPVISFFTSSACAAVATCLSRAELE